MNAIKLKDVFAIVDTDKKRIVVISANLEKVINFTANCSNCEIYNGDEIADASSKEQFESALNNLNSSSCEMLSYSYRS